ncbi:MAG: HlyD family efflux transporter periplasmic adaptor subunit [Sulfurovum sp.]|nr:HlyD family efflux transporter periplasmic adaptor subunit [Sulfurovum sp.]
MFKILIPTLIVLLSFSSAEEMKCESGKCSSGNTTVSKKVPQKPIQTSFAVLAQEKQSHGVSKITVKQLFNVRTTKVHKEEIAQKQTNYGHIVAEEARKVDVVAWYSGFVEKLYVNTLYQFVKEGQILAKVYSPEVYKAKQDYLNTIKFNKQRPSASMVKSSRIKLELLNVCDKEIEDIEKYRRVDKLTTVFATSDGWIFEKNINEGSSFNSKNKLFQIVDLTHVWMEVKLYQNDLEKLESLKEFSVKIKGFKQTFQAKKVLLYPMLNPTEATATLRLSIENPYGILKPGMYATMHASAQTRSRLLIPRTATIRKEGKWYAFLATEFKGEYEPIVIDVRPMNAHKYEVLSGLTEGESVVENALFMMDSDAQINSVY